MEKRQVSMFKQLKTLLKISASILLLLLAGAGLAWSQTKLIMVDQNTKIKNYKPRTKNSIKTSKASNPSKIRTGVQTLSTETSAQPRVSQVSFDDELKKAPRRKFVDSRISTKRKETLFQSMSLKPKEMAEEEVATGSFSVSHSQNLVDHQDGSKSESQAFSGSLGLKLSPSWSLSSGVSYSRSPREVDSSSDGFSDLSFGLGKSATSLAEWLKGSPSISLVLPTSKYSQKYQHLQASVGAGYRFALTPAVLAKGFGLSLSFGASRNFHEYETDITGRILNQYSLREGISGSYSIHSWNFGIDFSMRHGFDYKGNVSQAFEHSEEIGYAITPKWSFSVGHTNSGAWLKPNGQDSNLSLIDENDSFIYGSTSVSF